jgi:hypothetical protein
VTIEKGEGRKKDRHLPCSTPVRRSACDQAIDRRDAKHNEANEMG